MRPTRLVLLALLGFATTVAVPQQVHSQQVRVSNNNSATDGKLVPRMKLSDAKHAITTRDGVFSLLLTEQGVLMQLTERGLDEVISRDKAEERGGLLSEMVSSMLRSGVRTLLNRGIELPYDQISDARFENGTLYFIDADGERVMQNMEINGKEMMKDFDAREAQTFIRHFRAAKKRT